MERRGLGALEMLAMELKANGAFVSRGLSWKGAEFEIHEVCMMLDAPFSKPPNLNLSIPVEGPRS